MTAQDDEKHYEQEETRAKTGNSRWTAEAIRALGATTDLQTLADIFGCSGWSSRKMARTGEWERQGLKIFRIGAHYASASGRSSTCWGSAPVTSAPPEQPTPASWTRLAGTPRTARSPRHPSQ